MGLPWAPVSGPLQIKLAIRGSWGLLGLLKAYVLIGVAYGGPKDKTHIGQLPTYEPSMCPI